MIPDHYAVDYRHRRLQPEWTRIPCETFEGAAKLARDYRGDGYEAKVHQPATVRPLFLFAYALGQLCRRSDELNPASDQVTRAVTAFAEMEAP